MTRAQLAQLAADLAAARVRRSTLEDLRGQAWYAGGERGLAEVDAQIARVDAELAELEERRGLAPPEVPAPASPAHEAPPTAPEYLTSREAAALLRLSVDTLERLRRGAGGPPFKRVGRRVLYPRAELLAFGNRK